MSEPARAELPVIEMQGAAKWFLRPDGGRHVVLRDLNFRVAPGEFVAVVGPTGCGKSTTLNLIAGLDVASAGEVRVLGAAVSGIHRHCAYMFQTDASFPWKPVLDNVAAGLLFRGTPRAEAREQAREWIKRVGLGGFEHHYPHQLSGGMRRRVALAQSLITQPQVLLMDEPFSALDVQTRALMENELLQLWSESGCSVVFVTHDLEEAIAMADRVFVISAGPAARLKSIYPIDLPRPRNVTEIKFTPGFTAIYQQIWEDLRSEVMVSYERQRTAHA